MMKSASVLLMMPDKVTRRVVVHYEVNPVGSKNLYKLHRVIEQASKQEWSVPRVEQINHPDHIDLVIADTIHGDFRKEIGKPPRKKSTPPKPPEPGQSFMDLDTLPEPKVPKKILIKKQS